MTDVVVLGAGYAGCEAVRGLESKLGPDAGLTWISREDYHFLRHEVHRLIRDPGASEDLTLPVEEIASPGTRFVEGEVVGVDADARTIELRDGRTVGYDYLLVALGSETATYGIPGIEEHALTLEKREDGLRIHERLDGLAAAATPDDPARVVVAGAGLSGVQSAGEVAALRDDRDAPIEIRLVEALPEILPGGGGSLRRAAREALDDADIEVSTDDPVVKVTADRAEFESGAAVEHDLLLWTGGITGPDALAEAGIATDGGRAVADTTFRTEDGRVFAIGDAAAIEASGTEIPPTAQAAWRAAEVAAGNVARAAEGKSPERWTYRDLGTLLSVGDRAIAHGVAGLPVGTFGGPAASLLKKAATARWIARVTSLRRAVSAWSAL